MKIETYSLGPMQTNAYLLRKDTAVMIIDPVDDAAFLLEKAAEQSGQLEEIVATHGHFDHIMAVGEIQLTTKQPLYLSQKDQFLADRLNKTAEYFLGYDPVVLPPDSYADLSAGTVQIGSFEFQVIETPGHTPGSVSLWFPSESVVFVGDLIFAQGVGRTDFSYASSEDLIRSIRTILKLPEETTIYPGHGRETRVDLQQELHADLLRE